MNPIGLAVLQDESCQATLWKMTLEELKAEVRAASPEVREELFALLGVLRRAGSAARARELAARLDDPSRWVSEEDAARRLGFDSCAGQ